MDKKIIWILIIVVILGLFMFKKQVSYNLEYIGKLDDEAYGLGDCALLNYNGHLVAIYKSNRINLFDMDGYKLCRGFPTSLWDLAHDSSILSAQFINNQIYLLIKPIPWNENSNVIKCENIIWNCDLANPATCEPHLDDCVTALCSYMFTSKDDIRGLCSDGNYFYGADINNNQLIKYTLQGLKIGAIPLGYTSWGCEYLNGNFYVSDRNNKINVYDSSFVLQDTYNVPSNQLLYDLTKIGNRFFVYGYYEAIHGAYIYDIPISYTYIYFINEKDLYLSGGDFQTFITNANQWIV